LSRASSGNDVFGHALVDWVNGGTTPEMIERDDGYFEVGAGPEVYLSGVRDWPSAERQSLRLSRGRVLDVGCGAGRVALTLQQRGYDVVGLDDSPLAAKAAMMRGVEQVWCLPIEGIGRKLDTFDTIVLFGNNFGLFATPEGAHRSLSQLARTTKLGVRILAESTSAYAGAAPAMDRGYCRRNLERGNAPGQARFRYHYGGEVGSWFDWLFVSRAEMREILRGTGWRMTKVIGKSSSEPYVAVLEKT
jgi:SAM-dependent methyltransferase